MKRILTLLITVLGFAACKKSSVPSATPGNNNNNKDTTTINFNYLALGDSYTVGQSLPAKDNYPNQTIALLKNDKCNGDVKIIATTGWTTMDLKSAVNNANLTNKYDVVTLLIGVNNQYIGMPFEKYEPDFEWLLNKAIDLAGGRPSHVIVLSIPDWGVTPFAGMRDKTKIAEEIDRYNAVNKSVTLKHNAKYIDITPWTREAAYDLTLLSADGLHPSAKEYARWAEKLQQMIKDMLK